MESYSHIPGRFLSDTSDALWFGGTSYLGMAHVPEFQQLVREGISHCGLSWGSSRNNVVQLRVYSELETFLTKLTHAPASLTLSSGMLAGQLVLQHLSAYKAQNIYLPGVHPALWGSDYTAGEGSFAENISGILETIHQSKADNIHIFGDSISSPHVSAYDYSWTDHLPKNKAVKLILDDSHGLGVLGSDGAGIYQNITITDNMELIVVASLNKAMGLPGGMVVASEPTIAALRQSTYFSACSPMAPAYAYAGSRAGALYRAQLKKLKYHVAQMHAHKDSLPILYGHSEQPSFQINSPDLVNHLKKNGIIVPSFAYPNPNSAAISRLTISALHTEADIQKLIHNLSKQ